MCVCVCHGRDQCIHKKQKARRVISLLNYRNYADFEYRKYSEKYGNYLIATRELVGRRNQVHGNVEIAREGHEVSIVILV